MQRWEIQRECSKSGIDGQPGVRTSQSTSNFSVRESLLQVVNLAKNEVIGEYLAHTNQIQFIKWIDQKNLITIGESVLHNDQARFSNIRRILHFLLDK